MSLTAGDNLYHMSGKCMSDIRVLQTIIARQLAYGADIPDDLNSDAYTWSEESGRLTAIHWSDRNLQGELSLAGLTALTNLDCSCNRLKGLDLKENRALASLNCSRNELSKLELSENTALVALFCGDNQLKELNLNRNTALIDLSCFHNQLTGLQLSSNKALTWLFCSENHLSSLDVSCCDKEIKVYCDKEVVIIQGINE